MVDIIVCPRCKQAFGQKEFYSAKVKRYTYCRTCRNGYQSEYRKLQQYGVSDAMYAKRLEMQNGGCAICGAAPEPKKKLAIDHDHQTGEVRGLLCVKCNQALGLLADSPEFLRRAIVYLSGYAVEVTITKPQTTKDSILAVNQRIREQRDMQNKMLDGASIAVVDMVKEWDTDPRELCCRADAMPFETDPKAQARSGSEFSQRRQEQVEYLCGIFTAFFSRAVSPAMVKQYLQSANNSAVEVLDAMEKMHDFIEGGKAVSSPASYLLSIIKSERKKREEQEPKYDPDDPYTNRAVMEAQREELAAKWGREDADLWFAENYKGPAA